VNPTPPPGQSEPTPPVNGQYPPPVVPGRQNSTAVAVVGALIGALVLLVGAGVGLVLMSSKSDKPSQPAAAATSAPTAGQTGSTGPGASSGTGCAWQPAQGGNTNVKDVGTPPNGAVAHSGTHTMTVTTNLGVVEIQLDSARTPCTAASFAYLAGKHFFDNSPCHRLTTAGIYVLQCGDPSGTGAGGPTYQFNDENLSAASNGVYPRGMVAMANAGPNTNGSQFFIAYKDSQLQPNYTPFGTVTKGMDIIDRVAAGGAGSDNGPGDGRPKLAVTVQSLTVS
jgi:peptidyl-prolyl cis-trans isomerase B (cyclophilin B)